jgi:long-chain acyl-CoA synthetase
VDLPANRPGANLAQRLLGAGSPDAVALLGTRGATTFAALGDLVERLAGTLTAAGVVRGDRVAILSPNDEAFVVAYLATLRLGAVAVALNPLAPTDELRRELEVVSPKLGLAPASTRGALESAGASVLLVDLDRPGDDRAPLAPSDPDDPAVLLFTSGTAGAPKAAVLTHGNLATNITQVLEHPGLRILREDVMLGSLPFHHVFGLNVVLGVSLAAGATVALESRFDASEAAAIVEQHRVTVLAGVPTMYSQWLALDVPKAAFESVRLAVSGAAPLPPEVGAAFHERFGVVVHQGYGLTEAAPIVTTTALRGAEPRPGSIGPPLPGVEVRIVDGDGADVLDGDPGELWVRGPNVFPGYWEDDEATAQVLTSDGWLRTGDIAVVEEHGDLRLVDRAKDLVIVSGFNVYPVEVEEVLRAQPGVLDAAVVGEPSPRTGEAVVAYVVARSGETLDPVALAERCGQALARYKCPSRIELVDELPRSVAGKLLRRELRPSATRKPT